jgi:hypothetical protein
MLVNTVKIKSYEKGLLFADNEFKSILDSGRHWFTGMITKNRVDVVSMRDPWLLRLNGLCTFRVKDPILAVSSVDDYRQALYRETQLALRAIVGTTELDRLLGDKNVLASQIHQAVALRVADFGLEMIGFGIRDIILPGEMKNLLNKVVESKKAAEANLITRREETAAMRSQANTAKMLEGNKTLMRLKELEVLEKIATNSSLSVICGDTGISDKVLKLI